MPSGPDPDAVSTLRVMRVDAALRIAAVLSASARRELRDGWLRDARLMLHPTLSRTAAAKALAADLADPQRRPEAAERLLAIIAIHNGRALKWRQIADVLAGWHGW